MWSRIIVSGLTIAATSSACSPHEFSDPTGATKHVLYERQPGGLAPAETKPARTEQSPEAKTAVPARNTTDVVELLSGHRIEGAVRQTDNTGIVIEVGGQTITFERDKVRAVYFGVAPSPVPKP